MAKKETAKELAKRELDMMDRYKTDVLYKNSRGEYFTNENRAKLSLKDQKDKVSKVDRGNVETVLGTSESNSE